MKKRYGLVFKIDDQCYLAEYQDGIVEDATGIDDNDGVYTDLNPREMSLVEIVGQGDVEDGERVSLQDLKTITIENEDDPEKTIVDLLHSGAFPEVAQSIFEGEELG
jgi:hypothetical protein